MKTNIHCRAELDPLYRAMRILEAEEEGLESALWVVCVGSGGIKIKARRPHGRCS